MQRDTVYFLIVLFLVCILTGSVYFVHSSITADYTQKLAEIPPQLQAIDTKIDTQDTQILGVLNQTTQSLLEQLLAERALNEKERKRLEIETRDLLEKLETDLLEQTNTLQEDLESQISKVQVDGSDFSQIIDDVKKSVVSIQTNKGQGSGVFFDTRGYLITNYHVVDDITAAVAIDHNSQAYPIRIVSTSPTEDIAILQVSANKTFSALKFEDDVRVGERVIAVGNPFGLSFSVSEGIISAVNRQVDSTGIGYIQTDVSINPGNSGGPLVNGAKRIVGINTFKLGGEGLGFAIPSPIVEDIAQDAVN